MTRCDWSSVFLVLMLLLIELAVFWLMIFALFLEVSERKAKQMSAAGVDLADFLSLFKVD